MRTLVSRDFWAIFAFRSILFSRSSPNTISFGISVSWFDQNTLMHDILIWQWYWKYKFNFVCEFPRFYKFRENNETLNAKLNTFLSSLFIFAFCNCLFNKLLFKDVFCLIYFFSGVARRQDKISIAASL